MKNRNRILLIVVFAIGMISGVVIRSWNGIDWGRIEYGNVADWVSGIGTIAALSSSVVFFVFNNRPSLKFKLVISQYNGDVTAFISNNCRVPGAFKYMGIRVVGDKNIFRVKNFKEIMGPFKSASPWSMYELTSFNTYKIYDMLDFQMTDMNNVDLEIGIRDGKGRVLVTRFSMVGQQFILPDDPKTLVSRMDK